MEKGEVKLQSIPVYLKCEWKKITFTRMKNTLLALLVFFSAFSTIAQDNKRDSLLSLISSAKNDSSTVLLYLNISDLYENSQPVVALRYCKMAEALSQRIDFTSGEIKSLKWMASVYYVQNHFDSAMNCYKRTLQLSSARNDSLNIGIALFNMGSTYRYLSELDSAVDYCLQGYKILESFGSKSVLARMSNGLQLLYYNMSNYTMAITYGENAVQQARELNDEGVLLESLSNLSLSYKDSNQLEKSRTVLLEALKLADQTNNVNAKATILLNLGGIAQVEGNYGLLREYLNRSLILHQQLGAKNGECITLRGIAIGYLQEKKYDVAKVYAEKALAIADSNNYKLEKAECLKTLSNIAYAMQNVVDGEKYFNRSNDLFTEIFKTSYLESAARYEKKYEAEKRDKQIKLQHAQLQKREILNYVLIGTIATLLIISFLSYRNYLQKRKLQQQRISELETEKKLTATEAVLKGEEQERTRLAKDLHDGLGGMLSGIKYSFKTMKENLIMTPENHQAFERSMDMLDSSIKEMRRVAHNMMPESLIRFGLDTSLRDFCNDINQSGALQITYQSIGFESEKLDATLSITIYRIIQELINNTMKHAGANTAIVQVTHEGGQIGITVEDDGKGFDVSLLNQSKGMGWNNIQSRVDFLKGKLDIKSDSNHGTSVHIDLSV